MRSWAQSGVSDEDNKKRVMETLATATKMAQGIERPAVLVFVHDGDAKQMHAHSAGRDTDTLTLMVSISKEMAGWILAAERARASRQGI